MPLLPPTPAYTTVSYTPTVEGKPLVNVLINGHLVVFKFDTGCNHTFISQAIVEQLGLHINENRDNAPYASSNGFVQQVGVDSFSIGGFETKFNKLYALPQGDFDSQSQGYIGTDFIKNYPVLLDFTKHQIIFFNRSPSPKMLREIGMGSSVKVSTILDTQDLLYKLDFTLANGDQKVSYRATIDNCSLITIADSQAANAIGVALNQPARAYNIGATTSYVASGFVNHINASKVDFGPATIWFKVTPSAYPPRIGFDLLSRYRILFDLKKEVTYFYDMSKLKKAIVQTKE